MGWGQREKKRELEERREGKLQFPPSILKNDVLVKKNKRFEHKYRIVRGENMMLIWRQKEHGGLQMKVQRLPAHSQTPGQHPATEAPSHSSGGVNPVDPFLSNFLPQ